MIARVFRPLPYPGVALFALVTGGLGAIVLRKVAAIDFAPARTAMTILGGVMLAASACLLISFIRGVRLDLALARAGLVTTARITSVEQRKRKHGGQEWLVRFTFTDGSGRHREEDFVQDDDGSALRAPGQSLQIRYHPDEPSIFRLLD